MIATHRRESRLAFALEALSKQSFGAGRFEVIVVRSPDTPARASAPPGLDVRFLRSDRPGAAAQRNAGWRVARAPLIAFTDDDCRPDPEWLGEIVHAMGAFDVVVGRTIPDPDEQHLLSAHARSIKVEDLHPWFPGCNIGWRRELLAELGGFDEGFEGAWGEDTDLALRARGGGAEIGFRASALVHHAVHARSPLGAARESIGRSALPAVIARHPEMRSRLRWNLFLRDEGPEIAGLALAIALGRRHRGLATLALPWAWRRFDRSERGAYAVMRQLAGLPSLAAIDLLDLAGNAAAAMKHRVVVL